MPIRFTIVLMKFIGDNLFVMNWTQTAHSSRNSTSLRHVFCSIICWMETPSSESVYNNEVSDLIKTSSSVPGKRCLNIAIVKVTYVTEECKKGNECCQACLYHHLLIRHVTSIKIQISIEQRDDHYSNLLFSSKRQWRHCRRLVSSYVLHNLQV
jgi:hypothetical protein